MSPTTQARSGTLAGWFAGQDIDSSQQPTPHPSSTQPQPQQPPPSRAMNVHETTTTRPLTPRPERASARVFAPRRTRWVPTLTDIAPVTRWRSETPGPANVAASNLLRAESKTTKFASAPRSTFPTDKRSTDVKTNWCFAHLTDAQVRRMHAEASPGPGAHALRDAWNGVDAGAGLRQTQARTGWYPPPNQLSADRTSRRGPRAAADASGETLTVARRTKKSSRRELRRQRGLVERLSRPTSSRASDAVDDDKRKRAVAGGSSGGRSNGNRNRSSGAAGKGTSAAAASARENTIHAHATATTAAAAAATAAATRTLTRRAYSGGRAPPPPPPPPPPSRRSRLAGEGRTAARPSSVAGRTGAGRSAVSLVPWCPSAYASADFRRPSSGAPSNAANTTRALLKARDQRGASSAPSSPNFGLLSSGGGVPEKRSRSRLAASRRGGGGGGGGEGKYSCETCAGAGGGREARRGASAVDEDSFTDAFSPRVLSADAAETLAADDDADDSAVEDAENEEGVRGGYATGKHSEDEDEDEDEDEEDGVRRGHRVGERTEDAAHEAEAEAEEASAASGAFTYEAFGVLLPITRDVVRKHLLTHLPLITSTYHRVRPPDAFMTALVRGVRMIRVVRGERVTRERDDRERREDAEGGDDECWVVFEGRLVASRARRRGEELGDGGATVRGRGNTSAAAAAAAEGVAAGSVVVAELDAGATFGDGALFSSVPGNLTVLAVSQTATLFGIGARAMAEAFAAAPEYEMDAIRARRAEKTAAA